MTTERVVVRMSRSDVSIPWALSFSLRGNDVIVSSVSPDGLSSKAGVLVNDTVVEVCGRRVSREEAERILAERRLDVDMVLTRLVTSHTCLPWNLTEKGNEVVVDHIDSRIRSAFNKDLGRSQIASATSNSSWDHPSLTGGNYSTRNETNNYAYSNTTSTAPVHNGSSSFHSSSKSSRAPFSTSIPITTTHSYSTNGHNGTHGGGGGGYGSHTTNQNGGYGGVGQASHSTNYNTAPAKFSGANGHSNVSHGVDHLSSPRSIPVNQQTFIDTSSTQRGRESTLSPNRVFYHSPSSRTRRDLSPGASIHHMQYNSPMNLYSTETAAEEYSNQTGLPTETRLGSKSPSYLNSETRRLIEESERGARRGPSPSHQSPCFDRISHAVGADY